MIRFDANVPPLPGVPQVPIGESFARLNEYPEGTYRAVRAAAAAYARVRSEQIVVGAGADGLIALAARTFLGPGRRAHVRRPTYPLYAIASGIEGAVLVEEPDDADLIWVCNPNNPTGELVEPAELAGLARSHPEAAVVVDEAYFEYSGESVVPLIAGAPNLIAIRTLSKAFGLAALRVGYAVASPEAARELERRRDPAPVSAPAASIAAAALRDPRLDVEQTVRERERMRSALAGAGFDCPRSEANFVLVRVDGATELAEGLEQQGLVVRRFPDAIRITVRLPAENDRILAALGAASPSPAGRGALVVRTTTETSVRASLALDGRGRARVATGIGFLDHLLSQLAFHGGLDLELIVGGDLGVDEHHTVEDALAALGEAFEQALAERQGVTRFGSATVPMDEARATASVDLVRRPHAEVLLAFGGDRIGGLASTLLPHALERFAIEAGMTLHLEARGQDDHHVAEAAFKATRPRPSRGVRGDRGGLGIDQGLPVRVVLADYGAGNLSSVCSALVRAGARTVVTSEPPVVAEAPLAVIAGVGNAESAARQLEENGLADALRDRAAAGRPLLGICLGMQLLFEESEEGGLGLGLLRGPVRRLRAERVPHMGWNTLRLTARTALLAGLEGEDVYFAHSYACAPAEAVAVAEVDHGGPVVAAVERGSVAGVQFHPERSGRGGALVLRNAIAWSRSA